MSRHQPGRRHTPGSSRLNWSASRPRDFDEISPARAIDETSSRRRIGRTHPTHACLPIHKSSKGVRWARGSRAAEKSPCTSDGYANAIGVRFFGDVR